MCELCMGIKCARLSPLACLQVTEYDCLLLEHVLGQRPADSAKVCWILFQRNPAEHPRALACIQQSCLADLRRQVL